MDGGLLLAEPKYHDRQRVPGANPVRNHQCCTAMTPSVPTATALRSTAGVLLLALALAIGTLLYLNQFTAPAAASGQQLDAPTPAAAAGRSFGDELPAATAGRSFGDELFGDKHPDGADAAAEERKRYYETLMKYRIDKHDGARTVPEDALEAEMQIIVDEDP